VVDVAAAALALSTEVLLAGNRKATNTDIGDRGGRRKDVRGCQGGTDSALGRSSYIQNIELVCFARDA